MNDMQRLGHRVSVATHHVLSLRGADWCSPEKLANIDGHLDALRKLMGEIESQCKEHVCGEAMTDPLVAYLSGPLGHIGRRVILTSLRSYRTIVSDQIERSNIASVIMEMERE